MGNRTNQSNSFWLKWALALLPGLFIAVIALQAIAKTNPYSGSFLEILWRLLLPLLLCLSIILSMSRKNSSSTLQNRVIIVALIAGLFFLLIDWIIGILPSWIFGKTEMSLIYFNVTQVVTKIICFVGLLLLSARIISRHAEMKKDVTIALSILPACLFLVLLPLIEYWTSGKPNLTDVTELFFYLTKDRTAFVFLEQFLWWLIAVTCIWHLQKKNGTTRKKPTHKEL